MNQASGRSGFSLVPLVLALVAGTPSDALADGRRGGRDRDRCDDRPRSHHHHRSHSHSSLSISIGTYGSGISYGSLHGVSGVYRGGYGLCEPPRPRYVAPVVCAPAPVYCAPAPVVVHRPVVVERPVYVERPVVVEQPVVISAPAAPIPPAPVSPPPSGVQDRDLGTTYLRLGDLENAARLYQRYLAVSSTDPYAQRGLGLVELGRGNALEGTRWIAAAYRAERSLAVSPPSPDGVGGTAVYQRMLDTAASHAGQTRTPEAWLSVAILQHGLAQRDAALQSLQRAREAGLDVTLLDAMTAAVAR